MSLNRGDYEKDVGALVERINRDFPDTNLYFLRASSQSYIIGNRANTLIHRTGPKPLWDYLCGYWQAKRDSNATEK